jgi:hypothetical protein
VQGTAQVIEFLLLVPGQLALAGNADVMGVGDVAKLGFELLVCLQAKVGIAANFIVLALIADLERPRLDS